MKNDIQELRKEYLKYSTGPACGNPANKAKAKKIRNKIKRLKSQIQ